MKKLLQYNAFGVCTITHDTVTATVTIVVVGEQTVNRTAKLENLNLKEVDPGETVGIALGIMLHEDKTFDITTHEMGALHSDVIIPNIKEVREAVTRAVSMAKKAAKIE